MSEIGIGSIVFENWKVIELIGSGSFGAVYKIQRRQLYKGSEAGTTQYAALKVIYVPKNHQDVVSLINQGMDQNSIREYFEESTARICREIEMMYPFKGHGNIVSYEDCSIVPQASGVGSLILIRMELLTPITKYAIKNPMNEERTIQLGIDMCQALEACEKKNIIHRDIKPENIFVNDFGFFKLGDFGIARTAVGTTSGTMAGTLSYMAPEIYYGQKYNRTVDIYSLGIVLYQYLNGGRRPFLPTSSKLTMADMDAAQTNRFAGKPVPPIAGIAPELSRVVCRACAFEPEQRWQTAEELKLALLKYRNENPYQPADSDRTVIDDRRNRDYRTVEADPKWNRREIESGNKSNNNSAGIGPSADPGNNNGNKKKEDSKPKNAIGLVAAGVAAVTVGIVAGYAILPHLLPEKDDSKKTTETTVVTTQVTTTEPTTTTTTAETTTTTTAAPEPAYIPEVGDIVTFGTYEQDGDTANGAEEIEWIVLDVEGDQALLISRYGLDAVQYNEKYESITWEDCTLRQWLNNDFLNAAFSAEEQDGILLTSVINADNPNYGTEGGNNTEDYIFCLSLEEAGEYFDSDDARICNPTQYAIDQGVYTYSSGSCWWWLRSPGYSTGNAAGVFSIGALGSNGACVSNAFFAVRPALWVEISNLES